MDDSKLDALLAEAARDEAPLSPSVRGAILADAAKVSAPAPRPWLAGLMAGLPAAAAGLWLGLAQPALVLQIVPGLVAQPDTDVALLDDVFGTWEDEG